ncbi:MAG: hypothetical protein U0528_03485 [Anaerolineae bacterium]|nr:hypothetical protein [Anaerolineae bacterium]
MFSSRGRSSGRDRDGKKQTLDYRYQLTRDLLTNLHRGECCAVIGVGSCGKSRLLLHLSRPETLEYHLGDGAEDHIIVTVQCNAFMGDTAWHAYEGITRNFMEAINTSDHPQVDRLRRDLEPMYQAVKDDKDVAFRHVADGISYLLSKTRIKLTLCFDEFDFVFEKFDAQLFRNLRALRNANKYQLTYLLAVRQQLPYQRDPESWADVEEFYELFSDNSFAIGPYDERDAGEMIADLERRYEFRLKKETRDLLYEITGGHSGLIGASFRVLETAKQAPTNAREMERLLLNEQSNYKECRKIWDSLLRDECNALRRLALNQRMNREEQNALGSLKAKGLIRDGQRGGVVIFSPIFYEFARVQEEAR